MHLSPHSLHQIDDAYLQSLEAEALRGLSVRLLADLKEAWDRLNQGPENSSRPPSSRVPWERKRGEPPLDEDPADGELEPEPAEPRSAEAKLVETKPARKAGKQRGAPGIGWMQVFQANAQQAHYPDTFAGCGWPLDPAGAVAYTGFQAVDLRGDDPAQPGLTL